MPAPHRQCASVLLQDGEGRVLLVHQRYGARFFGFPGGIVDPGETPPQAAVREAAEEVGVEVELEYQIGAYLLTGGGWPDVFASVYKGVVTRGEPKPDLQEIASIVWRPSSDLTGPLVPDAAAALEDFTEGRRAVVRTYRRRGTMPKWVDAEPER